MNSKLKLSLGLAAILCAAMAYLFYVMFSEGAGPGAVVDRDPEESVPPAEVAVQPQAETTSFEDPVGEISPDASEKPTEGRALLKEGGWKLFGRIVRERAEGETGPLQPRLNSPANDDPALIEPLDPSAETGGQPRLL